MPHSGRILCRDVIPSAVRGGGPRRAYRTGGLRMRHGIIFRSRTGLGRSIEQRLSCALCSFQCLWRGEPIPTYQLFCSVLRMAKKERVLCFQMCVVFLLFYIFVYLHRLYLLDFAYERLNDHLCSHCDVLVFF